MDNLKLWEQTGLLEGVSEACRENLADCLTTQVHLNETQPSSSKDFLRCSIPLVRRVLPNLNRQFESYNSDSEKNIYTFRTKWKHDPDIQYSYDLDKEINKVASFSEAAIKEINELFADQYGVSINFKGFGCNGENVQMYFS